MTTTRKIMLALTAIGCGIIYAAWSNPNPVPGYLAKPATQCGAEQPTQSNVPPRVVPSPAPHFLTTTRAETVRMKITAFCPGPCRICGTTGVTASGLPATGKIVAADRSIPFGTVIDIPGYGTATVRDRGGAIRGNRLDVLMQTHEAARRFGVQYLNVEIFR